MNCTKIKTTYTKTGDQKMGLPDPPDDLDEFLGNVSSGSGRTDVDNMSREEILDEVVRKGSISLGGDGRFLISCPKSSKNTDTVCGIYPAPDPDGGGKVHVCTGPITIRDSIGRIKKGKSADYHCPYNPDAVLHDDSGSGGIL